MKSDRKQPETSRPPRERREEVRPCYVKPEVRRYGRIEPRLTFSPPGPPP